MKGARQLLEVKPQVDALCVSSLFGLDVVGSVTSVTEVI